MFFLLALLGCLRSRLLIPPSLSLPSSLSRARRRAAIWLAAAFAGEVPSGGGGGREKEGVWRAARSLGPPLGSSSPRAARSARCRPRTVHDDGGGGGGRAAAAGSQEKGGALLVCETAFRLRPETPPLLLTPLVALSSAPTPHPPLFLPYLTPRRCPTEKRARPLPHTQHVPHCFSLCTCCRPFLPVPHLFSMPSPGLSSPACARRVLAV